MSNWVVVEDDYYLQGYRLQRVDKKSNREAARRLNQATEKARDVDRRHARAHGLLSFTVLTAWLNDWIDDDWAEWLRQKTQAAFAADNVQLPGGMTINWPHLTPEQIIFLHALLARHLDPDDYDCRWSAATALLYCKIFDLAFEEYAAAKALADSSGAPKVCRSSLAVDRADALFFVGNPNLTAEDGADADMILEAISKATIAIAHNPNDAKRHQWRWTLGWAYYELAGCLEENDELLNQAKDILHSIKKPHDLVVKNIIAIHMALNETEQATALADAFMLRNPTYTIAVEDRWPYRSIAQHNRFKNHLIGAGLKGEGQGQA
jgi:hypothetical protein